MAAGAVEMGKARFPKYGLYVLLAAYTFCYLDRQVINILAEPIKHELKMSDAELGLLTGLSFAIFYTVLAIPIARLSELKNRSSIIVACLVAWSGFTMLCGLARSLTWLFMARIGVGVGEAGCFPASQSMISDYLPRDARAWSLSVFLVGAPLGLLLGMALGGIVAGSYGWRAAFLLAGAPGLLVAVLVRFFLRDPLRERGAAKVSDAPSLRDTLRELRQLPGFGLVLLGGSLTTFFIYSQNAFIASFFLRTYATELIDAGRGTHPPVAIIGTALGLILGLGGAPGYLLGGYLGDRLAKRGLQGYLTVAATSCLLVTPIFWCVVGVRGLWLALALLVPATILNSLWAGPVFAAIQSMVHERSRATAAAIALLVLTLFGLGLGPLSIGALSDHLARSLGPAEGLRWALACSAAPSALAAIVFWLAGRQAGRPRPDPSADLSYAGVT